MPKPSEVKEHSVLLYLEGEDFDRMVELSDELTEAIESSDTGMFDGNEIGGGETVLFMYGPDAERLFSAIEPVLRRHEAALGSRVVIRWGGPGAPQRELIVGEPDHRQ